MSTLTGADQSHPFRAFLLPIPGYLCGSISIHVPRMGSDLDDGPEPEWLEVFQSTLPHGERQWMILSCRLSSIFQSTLPAWGATSAASRTVSAQDYFNPRSRMGSDQLQQVSGHERLHFNPRSRMGSDAVSAYLVYTHQISIHAPAWGAPEGMVEINEGDSISIHAPRMGSDGVHYDYQCSSYYFNPRSRMGSDLLVATWPLSKLNFNPRSRMGSDGDAEVVLR